jgi:Zn finger protein HypA/HybF involved in hydrogenase expression
MRIHIHCPACKAYIETEFKEEILCPVCGKKFAVIEGKQPALAEG